MNINTQIWCILISIINGVWIATTLAKWLLSDDYDSLYAVLKSQWQWIRSKRLWSKGGF